MGQRRGRRTRGWRGTRGIAARTRVARWIAAGVVLISAAVAVLTGWAQVCDSAGVCRPPEVTDAVTLFVGVLVIALLLPDLSEAGVPGLLTLKKDLTEQEDQLAAVGAEVRALAVSSAVGGGAVVNISGLGTASWAGASVTAGEQPADVPGAGVPGAGVPGADHGAGVRGDLQGAAHRLPAGTVEARAGPMTVARDQARYLAAELLVAHLGDMGAGLLDGLNLRLYLPTDDGSVLLPVLHPTSGLGEQDVWPVGEGAVGRAWSTRGTVTLRGAEITADVAGLPPERRRRYSQLAEIAAQPVLEAGGAPIAVLSASTREGGTLLDDADTMDELVAAAEVVARVLIDLLGWAADGSGPGRHPDPGQPADQDRRTDPGPPADPDRAADPGRTADPGQRADPGKRAYPNRQADRHAETAVGPATAGAQGPGEPGGGGLGRPGGSVGTPGPVGSHAPGGIGGPGGTGEGTTHTDQGA